MGIKGLINIIKKHCPEAYTTGKLSDFSGKVITIDTSIFMYRFSYFSPNFISIFAKMLDIFASHNIVPVFVFDGKPPDEKNDTLKERNERRKDMDDRIVNLKNEKEEKEKNNATSEEIEEVDKKIAKLEKSNIRITGEKVVCLKELFREYNIQFIEAPCEAEKFCAWLVKKGYADAVMTEDTDVIPLDAKLIIRSFSITDQSLETVNLDILKNKLGFDNNKIIDLCILLGCDYLCTIPKVGSVGAFNAIKKHGSIDAFIANDKKITIPNNYDYKGCRGLFTDFNEINDYNYKFVKVPKKGKNSSAVIQNIIDKFPKN
jgi:flap endonuclease-1